MSMITVVVPVYNSEPYLRRCVDSILGQTFADFDLCLVDDGSRDRSGALCDAYAARDARVHVIHQANGGVSASQNAGLDWAEAHSASEYVAFIDPDDWVSRDYLEELYRGVRMSDGLAAVGSPRVHSEAEADALGGGSAPWAVMPTADYWVSPLVNTGAIWAKLYAKRLFRGIRYPLGKMHEDQFVAHRLAFQVARVAVLGRGLYYYYQRPDSLVGSSWNESRLDALDAWLQEIAFFSQRGLDALVKNSRELLIGDCMLALRHLPEGGEQYKRCIRLLRENLEPAHVSIMDDRQAWRKAFPIRSIWLWPATRIANSVRKNGCRTAVSKAWRLLVGGGSAREALRQG